MQREDQTSLGMTHNPRIIELAHVCHIRQLLFLIRRVSGSSPVPKSNWESKALGNACRYMAHVLRQSTRNTNLIADCDYLAAAAATVVMEGGLLVHQYLAEFCVPILSQSSQIVANFFLECRPYVQWSLIVETASAFAERTIAVHN